MAKKSNQAGTTKARAISLHIGLNAVSPAAYEGWDGPLAACESDAHDMSAIAKTKRMKATVLMGTKRKANPKLCTMRPHMAVTKSTWRVKWDMAIKPSDDTATPKITSQRA